MLVRPDDGAVDHLQAVGRGIEFGRALVERLEDRLPKPCKRPAPELSVNARLVANSSGRARRGLPVRAIQKTPSSTRRWSLPCRPLRARTLRMNGSKNAHSASDISPRAITPPNHSRAA